MPVKEIIGKTIAFGLVSLSLLGCAVLVFIGPHPYNDYLNFWLGLVLLLLGLGTGGLGTLSIAAIIVDARLRQREAEIHVAPRHGPPDLPPAWGMGEIGRPLPGDDGASRATTGGGVARVMSVSVTNIDAPIVVGLLLVWTVIALLFLAPR